MWDPQWETFSRSHRVVRYDQRGFGRSPIGPGRFSNARDLLDLIEQQALESSSKHSSWSVPGCPGTNGRRR
jgi:pimeloyl-ACP methyl ester carboxylesterase